MTEFYHIEARHPDWMMILGNMLGKKKPTERDVQVSVDGSDTATYTISKELVSAAELALTLGITEDLVLKAKRLVLKPIGGDEDWQKPTVSYVGRA